MVPQVADGAREPAVTVEQARRMRQRTPSETIEFGVEREVQANIVIRVGTVVELVDGVTRPRARHHQCGRGCRAVTHCRERGGSGGVGRTGEIGA